MSLLDVSDSTEICTEICMSILKAGSVEVIKNVISELSNSMLLGSEITQIRVFYKFGA